MNEAIEVGPLGADATPAEDLTIRQTDLGEEKLCERCRNWWPHDSAFFYANARGGFAHKCRACHLELDRARYGRRKVHPPVLVPEVFSVRLGGAA